MKATSENIEQLKNLGFKEINPKKLVYKDITAYMPLDGEYISFKYDGKNLPIISEISSIKKIIEGIYEYENFSSIGVELILKERQRQIEVEGWTSEHDSEYKNGELAYAAAVYAALPTNIYFHDKQHEDQHRFIELWPWDKEWLKPSPNNRIKELAKAGALIAAQIDVLMIKNK